MTRAELAMFPLSCVLLPGEVLELHVFEDRYRTMVKECLEGDGTFGVVLISRGSEVGGGDERFRTGTVATIESVTQFPDGRYGLWVKGTGRVKIREWLPDDPYPRATVDYFIGEPVELTENDLKATVSAIRNVRGLYSELVNSPPLPEEVDCSGLAEAASFRLCALVPLNAIDRQGLLEIGDPSDRLTRIRSHCGELSETLMALLSEAPREEPE